jgi:hypothetical protein
MSLAQSYSYKPGPCGYGPMPTYAPTYGYQPCGCPTHMVSPYELAVASGGASAEAFVGGAAPVHVSLEYVVDDGAATPSIKVTTVSDGSSSTWEETAPAAGYQVKSDFTTLQPGAKLTLEATEAAARLRWCETFPC